MGIFDIIDIIQCCFVYWENSNWSSSSWSK